MSSSRSIKSIPQLNHLVEVMRNLDVTQHEDILDALKVQHPSLAEALLDAMFTFDDLIYLTDRSMQFLLKEVERKILIKALKQTSDEVMNKILNNLSKRATETLLEEIELLPLIRMSEVREAQKNISKLVRSLEESGKVVMIRPEDDDPLV